MAYYAQGGYTHQNPAYQGTGEKYRANDTSVPMTNVAMVTEQHSYSWCTPCWGLFSLWCCGLWGMCCGVMGLFFSVWSYTDHKTGDFENSEFKKRWAIGCIVVAIFLGLASIGALIAAFFLVDCETLKEYTDFEIEC